MASKKASAKYAEILSKQKNETYYHIDDACDFLALSKRTVVNYVKAGHLKGVYFRDRHFFSEKELIAYLNSEITETTL